MSGHNLPLHASQAVFGPEQVILRNTAGILLYVANRAPGGGDGVGYAPGALWIDTSTPALRRNTGTAASATWQTIASS